MGQESRADAGLKPPITGDGAPSMSYQSGILIDTPTAYLELEDDGVGLVAADSSGNGLNAAYSASGVTYLQPGPLISEVSKAVTLDGVAGIVTRTLTGANKPGFPFCLEVWIDPISVASGDVVTMLVSQQDFSAIIKVGTGGTTWRLEISSGGNERTVEGGVVSGGYQHLFARFVSPTKRHLYVDAVPVATNTETIAWSVDNDFSYLIGSDGSGGFANASFSRVAYYNHDVTPQRIAEHYANSGIGQGSVGGRVAGGPAVGFLVSGGPAVGFLVGMGR